MSCDCGSISRVEFVIPFIIMDSNDKNGSRFNSIKEVPFINCGKQPGECMHVMHLLPLPSSTAYGNLTLKWWKIVQRLEHVNVRIKELNLRHRLKYEAIAGNHLYQGLMDELMTADEVVFWLRRTVDELISLNYLKETFLASGKMPSKIKIDCISNLLDQDKMLCALKERHSDFLTELNEVSNAHKHSFINSDINYVGSEESHVFAVALERNDLKNKPKFYAVPVRKIVESFNLFYEDAKSNLSSWVLTQNMSIK